MAVNNEIRPEPKPEPKRDSSSALSYLTPGDKLGKYLIRNVIGRGGMAEVYRAYNPDLNQDVAIKILHPHVIDSPVLLARFRQEARAVAALSHPNIVRVIDFTLEGEIAYMVMELIDGPSLRQKLTEYPSGMPIPEALALFRQVAEAVAYAHERGIIHRDIKPGNILLDGSRAVLTDFGLARVLGSDKLTETGTTTGTPAYMSPEQAMGLEIRPESDIYALGVVLFEMVTGSVPFTGSTSASVTLKHVQEPPPRPSSLVIDLNLGIEYVILRAMMKTPSARFGSAPEMIHAIDAQTLPDDLDTVMLSSITRAQAPVIPGPTATDEMTTVMNPAKPALATGLRGLAPVLVIALLVLILGLLVVLVNRIPPGMRPGEPTAIAASENVTPPEGMVYAPGGTFTMGTASGKADEAPPHAVTLPPFFLDRTEVTNRAYADFVRATGRTPPSDWSRGSDENWKLEATSPFAIGTPQERFSYDGKNVTPLTGTATANLNSDSDSGEMLIEVTGAITYQLGNRAEGRWRIEHRTFTNDQPFFEGGVATNVEMHGGSGQEGAFYPTMLAELATWGFADLYLDEKLLFDNLEIHTMLSKGLRHDGHRILKEDGTCCYQPQELDGQIDPNRDELIVLLFSRGAYGAAGTPTPDTVWIELYFTQVNVISRPEHEGPSYAEGMDDHPVTSVTWADAVAYCEWAGKRLPTEAEWEFAARGGQNVQFPWGNEARIGGAIPANFTSGATMPVGSLPAGASTLGALDMAGNVWEWVNDWYDPGYYAVSDRNRPLGPTSGTQKVLRGGGFNQLEGGGLAEYRTTARLARAPETAGPSFGFRCAQDK